MLRDFKASSYRNLSKMNIILERYIKMSTAKRSKDQSKEADYRKVSNNNDRPHERSHKELHHDNITYKKSRNSSKSSTYTHKHSIDTKDIVKTVMDTLTNLYNQIADVFIPYLYQLFIAYTGSKGSKHCSPSKRSVTDSDSSTPSSSSSEDESGKAVIGGYVQYIPLLFELYYMLFHTMFVRIWFMANFIVTCLYIYDTLSAKKADRRVLKFTHENLKNVSIGVIAYGGLLILFSAKSIGLIAVPVMLYLINRTVRNIFNKGF